ncbi:ras-associated guanine nucleotide exchange factor, putative [Bodo saltans]|uniref:Ras-associated guanine nucleotide exchange factor, putative n=1 Tax=Bodo saltans TaxID=75058 RepID=A0A0S4JUQ0_BODSA|nr:ras-associated guanine nucleotide exchange factor, putative [Bodo saltans]|eukprot:CUG93945.1 ras-associated guanine nucleotide exchange factor, putative [Bodo saltans]
MQDDDFRPPSDDGSGSGSSDSEIIQEEIGSPINIPAAKAGGSGAAGGVGGLSSHKSTVQHRPRGNSVWALQQMQGGAGNRGGAATSSATTPAVSKRRDIYEIEHALQYRTVMKNHFSTSSSSSTAGGGGGGIGGTAGVPLTFGEHLHLSSIVHEYLIVNGFSWAADAFRQSTPVAASFAIPKDSTEKLDFHLIIAEEARRTSLLFDDDLPWRSEHLNETEITLVQVDSVSQAAGGTLELLLEKLIVSEKDAPYVDGKPDFNFTNVFLIMAPLFVCPDVMLTFSMKMFKTIAAHQRYLLLSDLRVVELQRRILSVLRSYLLLNSADFTVTALERLSAFCVNASMQQQQQQQLQSSKATTDISASISELRTAVHDAVANGTARRIGQLKPRPRPQHDGSLVPRFSATAVIQTVLDVDDHELCRQICLLSFALFEEVHLRELLHNAWTDNVSLRHLTRNLTALIDFSTQFQLWVASTVVLPTDIEVRRTAYRKWIRVCRALYNSQNYEMVNSVLEGLRNSAVHRLKVTVDGIESEEKEELEGLMKVMDPFDNTLQEISYHIDSPSIPAIAPLLSVFYRAEDNGKTLVFVESHTTDSTSINAAVNWSKIMQLAKPSFRWISFQSLQYPFHILPNVQRYLWQMPGKLHPDRLMEVSRRREAQNL